MAAGPEPMALSTSESPTRRFRELDGLRGIAAMVVVFTHFIDGYDSKYIDEPALDVPSEWGGFGVHLFFLISGFVILMSARRVSTPSDFVISRVSRLYPAYWIALTVAIVVSFAFRVPTTEIPWIERIVNYTMLQRFLLMENQVEVFWTLAVELQFYALILVLLIATRSRISDRLVLIVGIAWMIVSIVLSLVMRPYTLGVDPQSVITPVKIIQNLLVVEWGPYFSAGMLVYLARGDRSFRPWAVLALVVAPTVSWITQGWYDGVAAFIVVLLFALVVFRDETRVLLTWPLQFFGRISYSLYICHTVLAYALIHLLVPHTGRIGAMIIVLPVVIAYSWSVYRIGEVAGSRLLKATLISLRQTLRDRTRSRQVNGS